MSWGALRAFGSLTHGQFRPGSPRWGWGGAQGRAPLGGIQPREARGGRSVPPRFPRYPPRDGRPRSWGSTIVTPKVFGVVYYQRILVTLPILPIFHESMMATFYMTTFYVTTVFFSEFVLQRNYFGAPGGEGLDSCKDSESRC